MTPTEAITILGGTVTKAAVRITQAASGSCSLREHEAIHALALHALTDSVARGALERVRARVVKDWKQFPAPTPGSLAEHWYGYFVAIIDRELAALTPTATVAQPAEPAVAFVGAVEAGLTLAETEDWMGKLCEDSAKVDKEVEDWIYNYQNAIRSGAVGTRADGALSSTAHDLSEKAVRIMRTRGDALRQMEKERDACCDDYQKEAARAEAAEAELARLRAEAKPRDEVEPEFPMQAIHDEVLGSLHTEIEALILWCVRKLGGAK